MADWSNCVQEEAATIACIVPLVTNIITTVMAIAGALLFIMLLVGGFTFLFAGGDPKKHEKAKGTPTAAVLGIVLIALSFLILTAIGEIFGLDSGAITDFQFNFFSEN